MTQDEIRERKLREAQETRNRLRSANQEQQVAGRHRKIPRPETLADSDTSDHRSRSGTIQTTTNGRLGNADFGLSALHRTESVSREYILGMDDVSVMWSTSESKDGPGRHSGEDGADNRSTSSDFSVQDVHQRRDCNRWQTKRRHSSDAVGFLCAKEWCTHLILQNHVFHRLRTRVRQLSPRRSR